MRRERGTAMVEFALVLPVFLLLLAGVLDYTMMMRTAIAVADAARAGAQFGSLNPANASNTVGIQTAAASAAPDVTNLTATASKSCNCSGGAAVACNSTCPNGSVRVYVQVTVQATSSPIFSYTPLLYNGRVSATASMRAQ